MEERMEERIVDTIKESEDRYRLNVNYQFEIVADEGEYYLVRRKPKYPKTYEECFELLSLGEDGRLYTKGYNSSLIQDFQKLLVCRDAYWKMAGDWIPDWDDETEIYYTISYDGVNIKCYNYTDVYSKLAFPTAEMRDAFHENFEDLIEECKMFL